MQNKKNPTFAAACALAVCALITITSAYAAGCFQCPGEATVVYPSPCCAQGTKTPDLPNQGWQCNTYVLDQPGYGFGPCVPCYEPSYKKCEEGNPGNLTLTEYIGRCVGEFICEAILGPPLYRALPVNPSWVISHDAGYCEG